MSLIVDSHRKKRTPVLVGIATRRRVMKFGVVCDVDGKTYLDNGATVEYKGMRYIFYVKDIKERLLTQVRIISDVDPDQYFILPLRSRTGPKLYSYSKLRTTHLSKADSRITNPGIIIGSVGQYQTGSLDQGHI